MWEAIETYMTRKQPLIIIAGADYGQGSSRDWAAKGVRLAGVEAIVAEGFERIHRTNLIGMGVLPLQFKAGDTRKTLGITGEEHISIHLPNGTTESPRQDIEVTIKRADGSEQTVLVDSRLDTDNEIAYYKAGGILQYVLNNLVAESA